MRSCEAAPATPLTGEHSNAVDGEHPYNWNRNHMHDVYNVLNREPK